MLTIRITKMNVCIIAFDVRDHRGAQEFNAASIIFLSIFLTRGVNPLLRRKEAPFC